MKYAFALSAIGLWSSNALVASHALSELAVHQVLFLQFTGASLVFLLLKCLGEQRNTGPISLPIIFLGFLGLTGTVSLQYIAFDLGPITQTNVVAYAWPIMVAIAAVTLGQVARPLLLLFCAFVGFIGVALVLGLAPSKGFSPPDISLGYIAALASALCMAVYTIAIGRLEVSPSDVLLPGALLGVCATFLLGLVASVQWPWSWSVVFGLYLGIGPMGLGYYFWSRAMQHDARGTLAVFGYLTPVFSTILLLILLNEPIEVYVMIGIVIVLVSSLHAGQLMLTQDRAD